MLLANHFATRMAYELGRAGIPSFTSTAADQLTGYSWKGNIRELKNVVERAVYRADGGTIADITFDPFISPYGHLSASSPGEPSDEQIVPTANGPSPPGTLQQAVETLEISLLRRALVACRYNQRQAAGQLGLTYDQLRGKIRKYRLVVFAGDGG